jgi:hypothetical protein
MIPSYVHPFLWSYDINLLSISRDKKRIITNVLNLGTLEATKWLFETYSYGDLKEAVVNPLPGEWSKKSLNFWSLIFEARPLAVNERVLP